LTAAASALVFLDRRQAELRRDDLRRETGVVARQFASRLESTLERHLVSLEQAANFWVNSERVNEQGFYSFAAGTLALTPLCQRISAVDPSLRIRWIYPPEPNRAFVGFDVHAHTEGLATLSRARDSRATVMSAPLELLDGVPGFIVASPIYKEDTFEGALVCAFPTGSFFRSLELPEVLGRYREVVRDGGTVLFASEAGRPAAPGVLPPARETVRFGGRLWDIEVEPRPEVVSERLGSGRLTFWILGSIVAALFGVGCGVGADRALGAARRLKLQQTALQETRQRLDGALEQLLQAEKLAALGELVAGVAHEINNPLASVLGYTELALKTAPPGKIRRYLETAASEAERAGKIVRNLLTFARKHPPEKKPHSLNEIVEKTLELKAYHFRVNQIRLERQLDPALPSILLDGHQIQQVLLNLLNNAEQAIAERGRGGKIRVETRRQGDSIEMAVEDDGPGIPEEIQARIFEPFFTTKQDGRGTGLGLSLCHGIVQEHGGQIRVESRPGQGAKFVVSLPAIEAPADSPGEAGAPSPEVPAGLRILVVDDEPAILGFLSDHLRGRGHEVDTASDVPEAIEKIESFPYDLIVSDMKMAHGTGEDIYRAAKKKSPALAGRIVFTTGDGAGAEAARFHRSTGVAVLLKPCRIEDLDRAIGSAVRSSPGSS